MSGETQRDESGWTVDTLKQHYDQRFRDQEKAVSAALASAEKAVSTANVANEKRFESVNEFRAQLTDQTATFLPRKEYDARHETLESRVSELTDRMNRSDGQQKGSDLTIGKIYAAIAAVGAILGILVLVANGVL